MISSQHIFLPHNNNGRFEWTNEITKLLLRYVFLRFLYLNLQPIAYFRFVPRFMPLCGPRQYQFIFSFCVSNIEPILLLQESCFIGVFLTYKYKAQTIMHGVYKPYTEPKMKSHHFGLKLSFARYFCSE